VLGAKQAEIEVLSLDLGDQIEVARLPLLVLERHIGVAAALFNVRLCPKRTY
jgi:hypothetical protein